MRFSTRLTRRLIEYAGYKPTNHNVLMVRRVLEEYNKITEVERQGV